jgi:hypothetical protein
MDDIEEDKHLREKVNIYKKERDRRQSSTTMEDGDEIPDAPTIAEMLEDLDLNGEGEDVKMTEE